MNVVMSILLWTAYLASLYFAIFWFLVFLDGEPQKKKVKRLTTFPLVSVIIPAFNEEKTIKATMKSILGLDYPKDKLELIVINDDSTDNTHKIAQSVIHSNKDFDIKLIDQENAGKGASMNVALSMCKGEYFVCLDADSFVEKDALRKILPHFTSPDIAAVLPLLKVRDPKGILQKMQWYEYLINMFYKELMSRLDTVHVAPGPFSVYKKKILQKIGGFDANHNLTEDLEIALRLQSQNYRIIQLLDTEVKTIAPDNLKELYKQRNRWYKGSIINAIRYKRMIFNKKFGDFGLIQMPTIIASGVIALILITSLVYYSTKPYVIYLYNLSFVDFDFITFLSDLIPKIHILDLNFMTVLMALFMMTISLTIIRKSHICTREKVSRFGFIPFIVYLFMYFIILGVFWIGISFDLVTRKKQKW